MVRALHFSTKIVFLSEIQIFNLTLTGNAFAHLADAIFLNEIIFANSQRIGDIS